MWDLKEDATFHVVLPYDAKVFEEEFATVEEDDLRSDRLSKELTADKGSGELAFRSFCFDRERCRVYLVVLATAAGREKDELRKSLPASTMTGETISILSASWREFYSQVTFVSQLSGHNVETTAVLPRAVETREKLRLLFYLDTTILVEPDSDGRRPEPCSFQLRVKCFLPPDSVAIRREKPKTRARNSIQEMEQARYRYPAYDPMLLSAERTQMESMTAVFALEQRLEESNDEREESMKTVVVDKEFAVYDAINVRVRATTVHKVVYIHCRVENVSEEASLVVKDVALLDRVALEHFSVSLEGCVTFPLALESGERYSFLFVATRKQVEDGLNRAFRSMISVRWSCAALNREEEYTREIEWTWKDTRRKEGLCCTIQKPNSDDACRLRTPFTVTLTIENRTDHEVDLEVLQTMKNNLCVPLALYLRVGKIGPEKSKQVPLSYRPLSSGLLEIGDGVVVRDRLEQSTRPLDNSIAVHITS